MPLLRRSLLIGMLFSCAVAQAATPVTDGDGQPPLTPAMAGEFALQAGKLGEAARYYLQAAQQQPDDAGLAEHAARIGLLANDDAGTAAALKLWRKSAPKSQAMQATQATLDLRRNDARAAKREIFALMRDKDDGWRYALAALGSGRNPALSAQLMDKLLDADALPSSLPAWLEFGRLAQQLDKPELSARTVAALIKHFPDEPRVALLRARQSRMDGKPDEARGVLDGLLEPSAKDPDLRLMVAREYDALGDAAAAEHVLAQGAQDDDNYGLRAALLARGEDKAGLSLLYSELVSAGEPNDVRKLLLGRIAESLGKPQQALDWYRKVGPGEQRNDARLREADALHESGDKTGAYAALRALQSDADIDDARVQAFLLEAELHQKDADDAAEMDALVRGLAAYPDNADLLYARALAWERRDDIAKAEADLRHILVSEPDNVATLNALGYTLADRTARYDEALQLIDRARVAEPDNPAIIDSYGWVLFRLGRNDEALVELRRAFALQKDPEIGAHLGQVLWALGQHDEAKKVFDQARQLDPQNQNRSLQRALQAIGS